MKAIELSLGSSVYSANSDHIYAYSVNKIEMVGEEVYVRCDKDRHSFRAKSDATSGYDNGVTLYFNLEDAEMTQLVKREEAVKSAFKRMEEAQGKYQELVARYMFAEPSKPEKL